MIAQIITPSVSAELNRSDVTDPPIRIPGIHEGRGRIGIRNSSVPGTGTPMRTPINVRITRIHAATLRVQVKLLPQGASSRLSRTTIATTPTQVRVKEVLSNRITEITNPKAHIHHDSGCSCNRFTNGYFFKLAGVGISTPHSFAGNPLSPQINPDAAARILAT